MIRFFDRIFNRKGARKKAAVDVRTTPLSEEQLKTVTHEAVILRSVQYQVGSAQSVGMQREHNEDTIFALSSVIADGANDLPYGVFIVADGMGGHEHGEIASIMATRAMASHLIRHTFSMFLNPGAGEVSDSLQEIMDAGIVEAQVSVTSKAPGGGTTLTAALAIGDRLTIAHVGDSRAYLINPDGRMQIVTQDHSLVQRLKELGQITDVEARVHPQRNVLYRAIGQSDPLHADIKTHLLQRPAYLLLCSDGLWGVLEDSDIFRIVHDSSSPGEACQQLINAANSNGGPDNISVILVQFPE